MSPTAAVDDPGQIKRALIDASAGAISGTVTSPLDVIKIRFQVMVAKFSQLLQNGQDNAPCLMCLLEGNTSVAVTRVGERNLLIGR